MNRDGSNGAHSHNKKESENTVKESHGCPELVNFCCGTEVGVGGDSFRIIAARSRPAGTSKRRSGVRIHPTTSEIFGVDKSGRRDDETTAIRRRRSFKDNCRRFLLFLFDSAANSMKNTQSSAPVIEANSWQKPKHPLSSKTKIAQLATKKFSVYL